jgi:hypothetical protein
MVNHPVSPRHVLIYPLRTVCDTTSELRCVHRVGQITKLWPLCPCTMRSNALTFQPIWGVGSVPPTIRRGHRYIADNMFTWASAEELLPGIRKIIRRCHRTPCTLFSRARPCRRSTARPCKSGPPHQHEFGTESGAHCDDDARAFTRWLFGDGVAQYV